MLRFSARSSRSTPTCAWPTPPSGEPHGLGAALAPPRRAPADARRDPRLRRLAVLAEQPVLRVAVDLPPRLRRAPVPAPLPRSPPGPGRAQRVGAVRQRDRPFHRGDRPRGPRLRLYMDHLLGAGVPAVALTGISLGGWVSALLATVDDRLPVVIPNAAVTDAGQLAREWFPASVMLAAGLRLGGLHGDELDDALAAASPLTYAPLISFERRMIIGGLGDRRAPARAVAAAVGALGPTADPLVRRQPHPPRRPHRLPAGDAPLMREAGVG